ncbi:MAG: hypothetical protein Q8P59_03015 [Dehalococcoidia bacterium]|nr:hypothetical protein [Dehalococcoidia bacterium]
MGREKATAKAPGRKGRNPKGAEKASFYEEALSQAEQVALSKARDLEGLDEEIALLRVRLRSLATEEPENLSSFLKGMELLVKAVGAKYRLSKKAQEDLMESVMGVLEGVGGALLGEVKDG